jgi:hypothetical protein
LQGAQETGVGAIARGDPCGICEAARLSQNAQEVVDEAVLRDDGGVAQLTTPVQRIDQSRPGVLQKQSQPLTGNVSWLRYRVYYTRS